MYSSENRSQVYLKKLHVLIWVALATKVIHTSDFQNAVYVQPFLVGLSCSTLEVKKVSTGISPSKKLLHQTAFLKGWYIYSRNKGQKHRQVVENTGATSACTAFALCCTRKWN